MNAVELAARDRQVARHARARGHDERVELLAQLVGRDVGADVHAAAQLHALGHELLHAALDDALLDLEVGHAEAAQAAGGLVALEEDDAMPGAAQLLGGRHAGGAGAHDSHAAAGLAARRLRAGPSPPPRRGR